MMDSDDFNYFWLQLQTRTKGHVSALHYLHERSGGYRCLDTNSEGATEAEVDRAVASVLSSLGESAILPHSPMERWMAYAARGSTSMSISVSKASSWRRRAKFADLAVTIVGNNE